MECDLGWGLQASAAPQLAEVYTQLAAWAREITTLRVINVGGGLCWKQRAEDRPLSVDTWADLLGEYLGPVCRARGLTIACEPGTFVMATAGVLIAEVNTVEQRASGTWVGLDAGHNLNVYAAHYGIPLAIVPVRRPMRPPQGPVHVAGNIVESNDVFARAVQLPALQEGEFVALWPAGAQGATMASDDCMRGLPTEVLVSSTADWPCRVLSAAREARGEADDEAEGSSERFKRKVLMRWRWLAERGVSVEQAAM